MLFAIIYAQARIRPQPVNINKELSLHFTMVERTQVHVPRKINTDCSLIRILHT